MFATVKNRFNSFSRYALVHLFPGIFPLYIVNEYPKSGGTWLSKMLSDALNAPFPQNRLPVLRRSIIHGHYLHSWNMKNVVLLWRDGRDLLVSQYYHWLFKNERGNDKLVERTREELAFGNYRNIEKNLPEFMEYVYSKKSYPRFTWTEFVNAWDKKKI